MKKDFMYIADSIFSNNENFRELDDIDKENSFFILNRKFAYGYLQQAKFFNHKNIDKASAIDIWFLFLTKKCAGRIPNWYWKSKFNKKEKSISLNEIKDILYIDDELNDSDIDFLNKYYPEKIQKELKKLKKFKKEDE